MQVGGWVGGCVSVPYRGNACQRVGAKAATSCPYAANRCLERGTAPDPIEVFNPNPTTCFLLPSTTGAGQSDDQDFHAAGTAGAGGIAHQDCQREA